MHLQMQDVMLKPSVSLRLSHIKAYIAPSPSASSAEGGTAQLPLSACLKLGVLRQMAVPCFAVRCAVRESVRYASMTRAH